MTASASAIAVAGRWRKPEPRSSRLKPSLSNGMRNRPSGTSAATVATAKPRSPMARASGGSHSHSPSQDSARNSPTAVKSVASTGHSRSHRMVQRARRTAAASSVCGPRFGARAVRAGLGQGLVGHWLSVVTPRRPVIMPDHVCIGGPHNNMRAGSWRWNYRQRGNASSKPSLQNHHSQPGSRSSAIISSSVWRGRTSAHSPCRTSTSATSGRLL